METQFDRMNLSDNRRRSIDFGNEYRALVQESQERQRPPSSEHPCEQRRFYDLNHNFAAHCHPLGSHSTSPSPTRDSFCQLTHEILASPLLTNQSNRDSQNLCRVPSKFDPKRSMEVPLVYDR